MVADRRWDAGRHAYRRGRLPGSQRGHPGGGPQGRGGLRPPARRLPPRMAGRPRRGAGRAHRRRRPAGCSRGAARCSARRAPTRSSATAASAAVQATLGPRPRRRAGGHRRRGHARGRRAARRRRGAQRRGPQDDRQRPLRDRRHVRVPHRGADRHRRHRPAAHHRREPRPGHGRRGDGPPRGLARACGGARRAAPTLILVPERPFDVDAVCDRLRHRHDRGASYSIVVVAEGRPGNAGRAWRVQDAGVDEFGHVRLGGDRRARCAPEIEARTGYETRVTILGHVLRGGTPSSVRPGARDPFRPGRDRRRPRAGLRRRWSRCAAPTSSASPSPTPCATLKTVPDTPPRRRGGVLRVAATRVARRERRPGAPHWSGCVAGPSTGTVATSAPAPRRRPGPGGAMGSALDDLLDLLELELLEVNLFRGLSPDEDRQRVFGGQVAAQALVAAGRTVDADRPVHSLHAYFLRPGDPSIPIVFDVDRIRDGHSFTTRRRRRHPARPGHLQPAGLVPDRRDRPRPLEPRCRPCPDPTSSRRSGSGSSRPRALRARDDRVAHPRAADRDAARSTPPHWLAPSPRRRGPGRLDPRQRGVARRPADPRVRRRLRVGPHAARHRDAAARHRLQRQLS